MKPIGYGKLIKLLKATAPISKQFENEVLLDDRLAELFSCVAKVVLPKATEPQRWALWQCFKGLKGVRVTHRHIVSCVCRAAANLHYIHEGIAPFYWDGNRTHAVMYCSKCAACVSHADRTQRTPWRVSAIEQESELLGHLNGSCRRQSAAEPCIEKYPVQGRFID